MYRVLVAGMFGMMLFVPTVHAQAALPNIENAFSISVTPSSPKPGEVVNLSVESPISTLDDASIRWFRNGSPIANSDDMKSIPLETGSLGSTVEVVAQVTLSDGTAGGALTQITPLGLDILYDANSYTPPFYKGRALPAPGTTVRMQAIARFPRTNGSIVSPGDLVFTWRKGTKLLTEKSGRGRDTLVAEAPYLFDTNIYSVHVSTVDGSLSADARIRIPSVEPVLRLYQDHPLFGITYWNAIPRSSTLEEREMTFTIAPFFVAAHSANDPSLEYAWRVNNQEVAPSDVRNGITIGVEGTTASDASIALVLTKTHDLFLNASDLWRISLGVPALNAASRVGDPFRPKP